jgi:hypothetical protein
MAEVSSRYGRSGCRSWPCGQSPMAPSPTAVRPPSPSPRRPRHRSAFKSLASLTSASAGAPTTARSSTSWAPAALARSARFVKDFVIGCIAVHSVATRASERILGAAITHLVGRRWSGPPTPFGMMEMRSRDDQLRVLLRRHRHRTLGAVPCRTRLINDCVSHYFREDGTQGTRSAPLRHRRNGVSEMR